jgi:hypothetical protein
VVAKPTAAPIIADSTAESDVESGSKRPVRSIPTAVCHASTWCCMTVRWAGIPSVFQVSLRPSACRPKKGNANHFHCLHFTTQRPTRRWDSRTPKELPGLERRRPSARNGREDRTRRGWVQCTTAYAHVGGGGHNRVTRALFPSLLGAGLDGRAV